MSKFFITIAVLLLTLNRATAQVKQAKQNNSERPQVSVLFGLNQPLVLKGFNAEVDYWTKKWVFEYSHGIGLDVQGKMLNEEYERQQLDFKISHSLGFGVGYRFTKAFNLRFEPKVHFYETYYHDGDKKSGKSIHDFATYTLGLGAYYKWQPFENRTGFLHGLTVVPSVRYWQKVGSSLKKDKFQYANARTNAIETFKAPNIGIANGPVLVNISVGYTFN